jgi:Ca2+-binding RTX toxin-like protein
MTTPAYRRSIRVIKEALRLFGTGGNDRLTGGPGAEYFSGAGTDVATDFSAAEVLIYI